MHKVYIFTLEAVADSPVAQVFLAVYNHWTGLD